MGKECIFIIAEMPWNKDEPGIIYVEFNGYKEHKKIMETTFDQKLTEAIIQLREIIGDDSYASLARHSSWEIKQFLREEWLAWVESNEEGIIFVNTTPDLYELELTGRWRMHISPKSNMDFTVPELDRIFAR